MTGRGRPTLKDTLVVTGSLLVLFPCIARTAIVLTDLSVMYRTHAHRFD